MIITFDEFLNPSFTLTRDETQELEDTGYVITDNGYCVTVDSDGNYQVWKEFEDYDGLTLYHGGRK